MSDDNNSQKSKISNKPKWVKTAPGLKKPSQKQEVKDDRISKDDGDEKHMYALADDVIRVMFPDGLVFFGDRFHEYKSGWWQESAQWSLHRRLSDPESPFASKLATTGAMNSLLDALRARASRDAFPDPKPLTICLKTGVLDLETGGHIAHSPGHWHRNLLDIEYSDDMRCPLWERFLAETFGDDEDGKQKQLFLQEFMGYLLIPSAEEQVMLWMIGGGANGKSVVIEIMQALLGKRNYSTVPLDGLGHRFQNAVLQGKLANFCPEISGSKRVDEAAIKSIVGGDEIYAEKKSKDGFSFRNYARIVAAGNALPDIADTSHGFFRRLIILRFNRQVSAEKMDRTLPERLREELGGILLWALEGLMRFRAQKHFTAVPSSHTSVTSYKLESNPVALFIAECTKAVAGKKTPTGEVYARYAAFCLQEGYQAMPNNKFGGALAGLGFAKKSSNGKSYYPLVLAGTGAKQPSTRFAVQEVLEDEA